MGEGKMAGMKHNPGPWTIGDRNRFEQEKNGVLQLPVMDEVGAIAWCTHRGGEIPPMHG